MDLMIENAAVLGFVYFFLLELWAWRKLVCRVRVIPMLKEVRSQELQRHISYVAKVTFLVNFHCNGTLNGAFASLYVSTWSCKQLSLKDDRALGLIFLVTTMDPQRWECNIVPYFV